MEKEKSENKRFIGHYKCVAKMVRAMYQFE